MGESIHFNVIIPTRERADTLLHCLRTVIAQNYADLNIIVSDNFGQDNTREVVESFSDKRITYINTGKRLSMSHNWEFALNHVSKGWVMYLGDDDGLMPGCLTKAAKVITDTNCDAIATKLSHYFWPDSKVWEDCLMIPTTTGMEIRDSKVWLAKLMNGSVSYTELPMLYTGGLAKKSVVDTARDSSGRFFLSMTPDVYSAIAIASVTRSYVMLKEPIFLSGASSHSNGASWFGGNKNPGPAATYFSEENIPCHKALGSCQIRSIPILTYECYLQSSHLHSNFLKINLIDQLRLALATATPDHYPSVREYCDDIARRNGFNIGHVTPQMMIRKLQFKVARFKRRINMIHIDPNDFGVTNIFDATKLANAIYTVATKYKHWKMDYAIRLFGGTFSKLITRK
jgi:glycosyltransferase involved in cell wall biosynthesis